MSSDGVKELGKSSIINRSWKKKLEKDIELPENNEKIRALKTLKISQIKKMTMIFQWCGKVKW